MIENKSIRNISPFLFLNDGRLLGYKDGCLFYIDEKTSKIIHKSLLCSSFKERFLYKIPQVRRLLRLGIRTSVQIEENKIILFINKQIHELNITSNEISVGYLPEPGVRALYFTKIEDINGFQDQVVFGGYLSNPLKNKVHIYTRTGVDMWDIVYTFDKSEINHIHNIIPDNYNDCTWILTGDFDDSAAIWKATDNFKLVERVVSGNQIYRGCIGFPTRDGLIYATDAPYHDNSIRILKRSGTGWVSEKVCDIEGSSIYGCKYKDKFVFSTTVEPDGRNSTLLKSLFYQKRGRGIKDNRTHIYMGNLNEGFKDIYSLEKDFWPYVFQFGTIKFPVGKNNSDYLVFEPVATKKYDLKLVKMKIQ